jgi:hypothetical protein
MNRMVNESGGEGSGQSGDGRLVALTDELGAQLRRMGAAGGAREETEAVLAPQAARQVGREDAAFFHRHSN